MVIKTFLDKCNTIVKKSENNFGLNPILMLHYGGLVSRFIIYFDVENIKKRIGKNHSNFSHKLILTNCGSIDERHFNDTLNGFCGSGERQRATSFDVIAFEIPKKWDSGIGFDSDLDFWVTGKSAINNNGSNWYQSSNGNAWDEEGIYNTSFLSKEYTKFGNNEKSIVVSRQHFDYGNENLELDITEYINDVINGKKTNNGLCLAFSPLLEDSFTELTQYVGFFGKHTNTFFHPYIESRNNVQLNDNRYDFIIGKENNLFFYITDNDRILELDELPICTINGKKYPVEEIEKGYYVAKVKMDKNEIEPDSIVYDTWSNIIIDGENIGDIEMEFVTHSLISTLNIGGTQDKKEYEPQLQGINDYEKLNHGDVRNVDVFLREKFTSSNYELTKNLEYRIYVKDASKEIDVIKWDKINKIGNKNSFTIYTNDLIPNFYYIDIKYKMGNEIRIFKNCLEFEIVNNKTNEKK